MRRASLLVEVDMPKTTGALWASKNGSLDSLKKTVTASNPHGESSCEMWCNDPAKVQVLLYSQPGYY